MAFNSKGVRPVPQRDSAKKELRKNHTRRMQNLDVRSDLRKTIKKFLLSVATKNKQEAGSNLRTVYQKLDKAAKRNVMHRNTAARRKSRYSRLLATLS
jgi:small subunit ribosomal protein S20